MGERRGTKGLELWCKKMTEGYPGVKIDNMTTSWRDGLAFCAMIHHFRPELIDFAKLNKDDVYHNNELAFRVAEQYLGIPALLDAEDMVEYAVPDRLSILTYLSQFYQAFEVSRGSASRVVPKRPATVPDRGIVSPASTSPPTKMPVRSGRANEGFPPRKPCDKCGLPVFIGERLAVGKLLFHRTCFRCARCDAKLTPTNYYETETNKFCCETCPDEIAAAEALTSRSISDEQKSILKESTMYKTALEFPEFEVSETISDESEFVKARSFFMNTQLESDPPKLPKSKPPESVKNNSEVLAVDLTVSFVNNSVKTENLSTTKEVKSHDSCCVIEESTGDGSCLFIDDPPAPNHKKLKTQHVQLNFDNNKSTAKDEPPDTFKIDNLPSKDLDPSPILDQSSPNKILKPPRTINVSRSPSIKSLQQSKTRDTSRPSSIVVDDELLDFQKVISNLKPVKRKSLERKGVRDEKVEEICPKIEVTPAECKEEVGTRRTGGVRSRKSEESSEEIEERVVKDSEMKSRIVEGSKSGLEEECEFEKQEETAIDKAPKRSLVEERKSRLLEESKLSGTNSETPEELKYNVKEELESRKSDEAVLRMSEELKNRISEEELQCRISEEELLVRVPEDLKSNTQEELKSNIEEELKSRISDEPILRISDELTKSISEEELKNRISEEELLVRVPEELKPNIHEKMTSNTEEELKSRIADEPILRISEEFKERISEEAVLVQEPKSRITEKPKSREPETVIQEQPEAVIEGESRIQVESEECRITEVVESSTLEELESRIQEETKPSISEELESSITEELQSRIPEEPKPGISEELESEITRKSKSLRKEEAKIPVELPTRPQPKPQVKREEYPEDLNPFDDEISEKAYNPFDDEEDEEVFRPQPKPRSKKIGEVVKAGQFKEELKSTNPFGDDEEEDDCSNPFGDDDDDEEEVNEEVKKSAPKVAPRDLNRPKNSELHEGFDEQKTQGGLRVIQVPHFRWSETMSDESDLLSSPFDSDIDDFDDEDDPKSSVEPPQPKPRSSGTSILSEGSFSSNVSSAASSAAPSLRKKKAAPRPPIPFDKQGDSSPRPSTSLQASPSPRSRKVRRAPLPPYPTSTPLHDHTHFDDSFICSPISGSGTLKISTSTTRTLMDNFDPSKTAKDETNRNRQSESNISYSLGAPNKSTYGKWKRKKGQAPLRPVPIMREVKPLPMAEVRNELDTIEIQLQGLGKQTVRLEEIIRDKCEGPDADPDSPISEEAEDLIIQMFELINEKNELVRRQAELMYLQRQQRLEREHAEVEYEIRCLMLQPEENKTDFDKEREEELIKRLVDIVERRSEVIECLEMDRRRAAEEDLSINSSMNSYTSKGDENLSPSSKEQKKKKKFKNKFKLKGSSKVEKVDADKDVDESEVANVALNKVKKKKFNLF